MATTASTNTTVRSTTPIWQASKIDGPPRADDAAARALSDDGGGVGEELADKIAGLRIADI
ncbi:hypothetical protein ABL849_07820 [Variovorax sp. 375MFSha3.1]|uniref:Uncharacterized protein n=1 Tax=Variovorax guangxiensis TaxID=1775474 RepID=A0A840FTM8_9BURK|nr:hypothetical protein [Variovorax guangxiensis]MBB4220068.1 hypothetical protein [Variovorax guangxiensis]